MRDNGLTASAYTSMGGIDPLVSEPVLAALAEAGIAAYAVTPGEPGPSGEAAAPATASEPEGDAAELAEVDVPKKADVDAPEQAGQIAAGLDEIFVDADSTEQARGVIDRSAEDAEWKSLVEQFNAPSAPGHSDPPVPRWPASEDVDENSYEPLIDVPAGLIIDDKSDSEDEEDDRPARKADDPHDHFVPPEPPRGPKLDWISRAAWLGLLGGPTLLILAALFDFGTGRITLLAVVGFIAGFLTLVIRMNDRLPPEDTPDDGAVV